MCQREVPSPRWHIPGPALRSERSLQTGGIGGGAERGIGPHRARQGSLSTIVVVRTGVLPGRRLQRLGGQQRPASGLIVLRGGKQPGGIVVEQAAAVQRVPPLMSD